MTTRLPAKVKGPNPSDPKWLHYMSMPKLLQQNNYSTASLTVGDNVKKTMASYKKCKKPVQREEPGFQSYDSIQNLHGPLKLQAGVSNFIPDYQPDQYVQSALNSISTFHT